MLVVPDVLGSGEEHVLEQMREPRPSGPLVLRADVVPEVDGDERGGMVFVEDDAEAVGEVILVEGEHWGASFITGKRRTQNAELRNWGFLRSSFCALRSAFHRLFFS